MFISITSCGRYLDNACARDRLRGREGGRFLIQLAKYLALIIAEIAQMSYLSVIGKDLQGVP